MISTINNLCNTIAPWQGGGNIAAPAANETGELARLIAEKEMAEFKKEFYAEVENIKIHRTLSNVAINISEDAFARMKAESAYRAEVIRLLKRDLEPSYVRSCSSLINVGRTIDDYRATAWDVRADQDFWTRSKDSYFLKRKKTAAAIRNEYEKQLIEKAINAKAAAAAQSLRI